MTTADQQNLITQADRARDMSDTADRLAAWFERKEPNRRNVTISGMDLPRGAGTSNETILFDAHWMTDAGPESGRFVLRPHPGQFQLFLDPAFERQYELMKAVAAEGTVPVPGLIGLEIDPEPLGTPFYIMHFVPGRVPTATPPYNASGWLKDLSPPQRERVWIAAMEKLTAIHRIPADHVRFLHRPGYGPTGFSDEFNYWMAAHVWSVGDRPPAFVEQVRTWIIENRPTMEPPEGLSWGDARIGNMLFDDDLEVAAVLDWEQASLAGGLQDLGWWLYTDRTFSTGFGLPRLEGLGTHADTIAMWEMQTGQRAHDLHWYEVFAGFKLATILTRKLRLEGSSRAGLSVGNNPFTRVLADMLDMQAPGEED